MRKIFNISKRLAVILPAQSLLAAVGNGGSDEMRDSRIDLEPYGPFESFGEPIDLDFRLTSFDTIKIKNEADFFFDLVPIGEESGHISWQVHRPVRYVYFSSFVPDLKLNATENWDSPHYCGKLLADENALPAIDEILDADPENNKCLQNVAQWVDKIWRKMRTSSKSPLDTLARRISKLYQKLNAVRYFSNRPEATSMSNFKNQPQMLLLSTHNRLFWYDVNSEDEFTIHEGRGVYYGAFSGAPDPYAGPTVWVISRPHNWRATSETEYLLQFAADGSGMLREVQIPTKFAHDAVRSFDNKRVFVASTGSGEVLEFNFQTMKLIKSHRVFKANDHINTLSAEINGVWALLHGKGRYPSKLQLFDLQTDKVVKTIEKIGLDSHAAVQMTNASSPTFYSLSSRDGSLVRVSDGEKCNLNDAGDAVCSADVESSSGTDVIWIDPKKYFSKGLVVINNVAYIGASEGGPRQSRDAPDKPCDLIAVNISNGEQIWRKEQVDCRGLLNVVSAPHLSTRSTNIDDIAFSSNQVPSGFESRFGSLSVKKNWFERLNVLAKAPAARPRRLTYMPIREKQEAREGNKPDKTVALLGQIPEEILRPLQDFFRNSKMRKLYGNVTYARETNADFSEREQNANKFKPGVDQIKLIFSDRAGDGIYYFPWWKLFRPAILPILRWLDIRLDHVARLQFALHRPGADIKRHRDLGPWVMGCHRTHVPVTTSPVGDFSLPRPFFVDYVRKASAPGKSASGKQPLPLMLFSPPPYFVFPPKNQIAVRSMRSKTPKKWDSVKMATGQCFEINNAIEHYVKNPDEDGARTRIHLIIDWQDKPVGAKYTELAVGGVCKYGTAVTCPRESVAREVDMRTPAK